MFSKKKKNANKQGSLHKAAKSMQLPIGALPNFTHYEMNSNREVIIEGCNGILQYDENIIKVNMDKMITSFYGRNLSIKCLSSDSLIVEGFITSIEFLT